MQKEMYNIGEKSEIRGKRRDVELQNAIMDSITRFPKTAHGIAIDIQSNRVTVVRHLRILQRLGVVYHKIELADENSQAKRYWRPVR